MKVLVTGGCGFIGSHLCESLVKASHSVLCLDDLSHGNLDNIRDLQGNARFQFVQGDVTDAKLVLDLARGCHAIVHLAGFKIPRYGGARETLIANAHGAENVLEAGRMADAKCVMISTSDCYGMNPEVPFGEESNSVIGPPTVKRWSYAISKMYEEQLSFAYRDEFQLRVVVLRYFGAYGPRQHLSWWGGPQAVFITAVLKDQEIEIHGDGLQTRSFIYIDDLVHATHRVVESDQVNGELLNIGSPHEISILELANRISHLVRPGQEPRIRKIPYETFGRYQDVRRRIPDITKARTLIGFQPGVSLEDGLRRTIAWQRAQLEKVEPRQ